MGRIFFKDLINHKWHKLTLIKYLGLKSKKCRNTTGLFLCDCGNQKEVLISSVKSGNTKSCGCIRIETNKKKRTHNMSESREYKTWKLMKSRCYNKKNPAYYLYGAKGISVCNEWLHSFEQFYKDMGKKPEKFTIERKNSNGNYSLENCIWADYITQNNNTSRNRIIIFKNKKMTMIQWARDLKINYQTLSTRINTLKWSIEKAFVN